MLVCYPSFSVMPLYALNTGIWNTFFNQSFHFTLLNQSFHFILLNQSFHFTLLNQSFHLFLACPLLSEDIMHKDMHKEINH